MLAEPAVTHLAHGLADNVAGQSASQLVMEAMTFEAAWTPRITDLNYTLPHPEGLSAASFSNSDDDALHERHQLHALLRDDGAIRILGPALNLYGLEGPTCISVNRHMELMHQTLQLASHLSRKYLNYAGAWNIGVHLNGLAGQPSAQSLRENFGRRAASFQTDRYSRTDTVSSSQLADEVPSVVELMLKDLARGLGLQQRLFPYNDPTEIQQRT